MRNRQAKREVILDRLDEALKDLYHNATPHFPMSIDDPDGRFFEDFCERGSWEIDYISEGLGLTPNCWKKAIKLGFSHNERYFWLVSRIPEYGKLYQWGRGGRTVAPSQLIKQGGGSSFRIKDSSYFTDNSKAELVEMIQILEAFNHYVKKWNSQESILSMYSDFQEQEAEREAERLANLCPTCGR